MKLEAGINNSTSRIGRLEAKLKKKKSEGKDVNVLESRLSSVKANLALKENILKILQSLHDMRKK